VAARAHRDRGKVGSQTARRRLLPRPQARRRRKRRRDLIPLHGNPRAELPTADTAHDEKKRLRRRPMRTGPRPGRRSPGHPRERLRSFSPRASASGSTPRPARRGRRTWSVALLRAIPEGTPVHSILIPQRLIPFIFRYSVVQRARSVVRAPSRPSTCNSATPAGHSGGARGVFPKGGGPRSSLPS
jgi:hypothetical protein